MVLKPTGPSPPPLSGAATPYHALVSLDGVAAADIRPGQPGGRVPPEVGERNAAGGEEGRASGVATPKKVTITIHFHVPVHSRKMSAKKPFDCGKI